MVLYDQFMCLIPIPSVCLSSGAMSLAGAQGNMWAVEGGNKLVCSGLLKLTKANIIQATVTAISLHSSGEPLLTQPHLSFLGLETTERSRGLPLSATLESCH